MFSSLTEAQAKQMLALQAKNNSVVHKEWLTKGWPFLRAVVVEGAEGMEHVGWKWWKAQAPDWPQAQLELVDIWHFILSDVLVKNKGDQDLSAADLAQESARHELSVNFDGQVYALLDLDLVSKFELIVGLAVSRRIHLGLFQSMMVDSHMTWNSLLKTYIGKNVLNQFRQANGYKEGSYRKIWKGEEDNVHLARLLDELDGGSEHLAEDVWDKLNVVYASSAN
jgi:hypothetical protein